MISLNTYGRHTSLSIGYYYFSFILELMKYIHEIQQINSTLENHRVQLVMRYSSGIPSYLEGLWFIFCIV
jgi:hypothetical protein